MAAQFLRVPVAIGLALALTGCATNPVTGRREVSLMSPQQERVLGQQEAAKVAQQIGLVQDAALVTYVRQLGNRLAAQSPRRDVDYQFFVADMAEPNAFALPGGYIYVSRGLLAFTNSEDELANVIGHEIGHVAARHAAQRQTRATGVGIATVLGTILAGLAGGGEAAQAASQVGQAAGAGLIASYGRDQERQSDEIGQQLAASSGWDPVGMARFLATLEKETALQPGTTPRPGYLDSHPALGERVQTNAARAAQLRRAPPAPIAATPAEFYRRLDGLLVGNDPSQGVFRGQRFLHADLDFRIDFPAGWKTQNTPTAVVGGAPGRDALVRVEFQGNDPDPRAAAEQFAAQNQVRLEGLRAMTIGGYRAARARSVVETRNGQLGLDLTWVAQPRGTFRIMGLAPAPRFADYADSFAAVATSYRGLTAEDRQRVTGLRLKVVAGKAGESLPALATRTGNRWTPEVTAIANGLAPGASLPGNRPVKIAVEVPYAASSPGPR